MMRVALQLVPPMEDRKSNGLELSRLASLGLEFGATLALGWPGRLDRNVRLAGGLRWAVLFLWKLAA